MEERIQKIVAARAGVSRRAAEALIAEGRVTVNGVTASLGQKADPDRDTLHMDGRPLAPRGGEKLYIMLHKPVGYVTTMRDEKGRRTVAELVSDLPERVYPVGRLDLNSSGLLLMTNDGDFAQRVCHPSFEKRKTYRVAVSGELERGLEVLRAPMELDGTVLRVPEVRVLRSGEAPLLEITIHEGKNRQIRRMCEKAGLTVRSLQRISVGGVRLGSLPKGKWRYLTAEELAMLQA